MISIRRKGMAAEANVGVVVLCERLADATRRHTVEWNREGEDTFVWKGRSGTVSIGSRDKDGEPPYELVIMNAEGERLDKLTSQLLEDDRPANWNEPLADLYRGARRSALRADDVIQGMIDALP
jgi:hypothetical protein